MVVNRHCKPPSGFDFFSSCVHDTAMQRDTNYEFKLQVEGRVCCQMWGGKSRWRPLSARQHYSKRQSEFSSQSLTCARTCLRMHVLCLLGWNCLRLFSSISFHLFTILPFVFSACSPLLFISVRCCRFTSGRPPVTWAEFLTLLKFPFRNCSHGLT